MKSRSIVLRNARPRRWRRSCANARRAGAGDRRSRQDAGGIAADVHADVKAKVIVEIDKDFTKIPVWEIEKHMSRLIAPPVRRGDELAPRACSFGLKTRCSISHFLVAGGCPRHIDNVAFSNRRLPRGFAVR